MNKNSCSTCVFFLPKDDLCSYTPNGMYRCSVDTADGTSYQLMRTHAQYWCHFYIQSAMIGKRDA